MALFGALLDTNVLYRALLRDILLTVAEADFYKPYWSDSILEELERNLFNKAGKDSNYIEKLINAMNGYFPDALIKEPRYKALIPAMANNKKDRHVLAAAITARVEIIITDNLKDFPKEALSPYNIEAQHPDTFLLNLFDLQPFEMFDTFQAWLSNVEPPRDFDRVIEQLEKTVPGFAQALKASKTSR